VSDEKRPRKPSPLKGRPLTPEHKAKLSEAAKKHWSDPEWLGRLVAKRLSEAAGK
jgi:hypothetical protein